MIEIGVHKVCKNFGYKQVLNDVSFEVYTGDRIGIVGKNGSGKTTLFKLITKEEYPDSGEITILKNASIGYLEQIPSEEELEMSVKEILFSTFSHLFSMEQKMRELELKMIEESTNLSILNKYANIQNEYISLGGYEVEDKVNRVVKGFGLEKFLDKEYSLLSGGQKTVVHLAKLILSEPDILLLDEPTNHLDIEMLDWLENYLKKYSGTLVIISHDRYFLDKVTNKTVILDSGESQLYNGNYSYSLKEQEKLLLIEFEQYKNQQKKIAAIKATIKRYRDWGNQGDNEKFFKKAKELEKRLSKMEILDKPQLEKKKLPIHFKNDENSQEAISFKDFKVSFQEHILLDNVNLTIYQQDKIVLLGRNGSGKTTFIKAILNQIEYEGKIIVANRTKIGYIPQEILFENREISLLNYFRNEYPCLEGEARRILAQYGFYKDNVYKKVKSLSGGEKVLLKLAVIMQNKVNFLILDEPTNHIDIETREILEEALQEYQGTLLFVSHDRYFIQKIAKRQFSIDDQTLYSSYFHDYL